MYEQATYRMRFRGHDYVIRGELYETPCKDAHNGLEVMVETTRDGKPWDRFCDDTANIDGAEKDFAGWLNREIRRMWRGSKAEIVSC